MSLRVVRDKIRTPHDDRTVFAPKTALAFVLNRDFLLGLKVLCYSLAAHNTLVDLPILIISEDRSVIEDPFVKEIADVTRLATEEEILSFSKISSDKVDEKLKLSWIPKYTYLKWLVFDDYGFDKLIFIDADIVCMNSCDELMYFDDADLYGCPVFSRDLIVKDGDEVDQAATDGAILSFIDQPFPPGHRLNTGVMVINRRLLNSEFRHNLIKFAEDGEYSVEQAALRSYLRGRDRMGLKLISPLYNFKHDYITRVSASEQPSAMSKIRLLHFAGSAGKPWEKSTPTSLSEWIWDSYRKEAQRYIEGVL